MTDPKTLPSYMIRPSDGEVFVLANDGKYYLQSSLKDFPENSHQGYLYETLKCYRFQPNLLHGLSPVPLYGPRAIFTVKLL